MKKIILLMMLIIVSLCVSADDLETFTVNSGDLEQYSYVVADLETNVVYTPHPIKGEINPAGLSVIEGIYYNVSIQINKEEYSPGQVMITTLKVHNKKGIQETAKINYYLISDNGTIHGPIRKQYNITLEYEAIMTEITLPINNSFGEWIILATFETEQQLQLDLYKKFKIVEDEESPIMLAAVIFAGILFFFLTQDEKKKNYYSR